MSCDHPNHQVCIYQALSWSEVWKTMFFECEICGMITKKTKPATKADKHLPYAINSNGSSRPTRF